MLADHQGKWTNRPDKASHKSTSETCSMWNGSRQAEKFTLGQFKFKNDKTNMCNNKSLRKGINIYLKKKCCCDMSCDFSSMSDFKFLRWEDKGEIIRAGRNLCQSWGPHNGIHLWVRIGMQVWNGNVGMHQTTEAQPLFNQQVGAIWLAEDSSFVSQAAGWRPTTMPTDYLCGCVNNWGGPE